LTFKFRFIDLYGLQKYQQRYHAEKTSAKCYYICKSLGWYVCCVCTTRM